MDALSKTRFAEIGEIKEVGACYTFFWSGHKFVERREAEVGFAIKSFLVGKFSGLTKGINGRLMTSSLPLSGSLLCTYDDQPDEMKDKFYNDFAQTSLFFMTTSLPELVQTKRSGKE